MSHYILKKYFACSTVHLNSKFDQIVSTKIKPVKMKFELSMYADHCIQSAGSESVKSLHMTRHHLT